MNQAKDFLELQDSSVALISEKVKQNIEVPFVRINNIEISNKTSFDRELFIGKVNINKYSDTLYKKFNLIKKVSDDITNEFVFFLIINELAQHSAFSINTKKHLLGNFNFYRLFFSQNLLEIALAFNICLAPEDISKIQEHIEKMHLSNLAINYPNNINDVIGIFSEKLVNKKELGAYYTSIETTDYIVENSILPKIIKEWSKQDNKLYHFLESFFRKNQISFIEYFIKNNKLYTEFQKLLKNYNQELLEEVINELKIIDISCGSGSFIFAVLRFFSKMEKLVKFSINPQNIYGIDLDEEAILILKSRILLENEINSTSLSTDNFIQGNSLLKDDVFKTASLNSIIKKGGFDVVVGNPPYVESRKITSYQIENYKTKKCNNLYAFFLEKNLDILKNGGAFGMIVPISYISTKRMNPIRNLLTNNSSYQFCSSFADRPACLFNGVHQKLNIIFLEKNEGVKCKLYTSNYEHWYKEEQQELFKNLNYTENTLQSKDFLYKIGNRTEFKIIQKLTQQHKSILENCDVQGSYKIWVNMRLCFWNKAFTFAQKSKEYKVFTFKDKLDAVLFSALINSNIYFFFWEKISDVWHITLKDLNNFKIDFSLIDTSIKKQIEKIYNQLETNLEQSKKYIGTKQTEYEYQHKKDKILIDKIDKYFAKVFDLSNTELDYIKKYQLKYRMNGELDNYLQIKDA